MLADIRTVMWLEWKTMFRQRGAKRGLLLSLITPFILAVVFPLQIGLDFLDSAFPLIIAVFIPLLMVGIMLPDAIAGERERHTLSTLLASRLPVRAILIGKMLYSGLFAWLLTLLSLSVGLAVVNLAHGKGKLLLYSPSVMVANLVLSLLFILLIACVAVLVSLRAAKAQEATQATVTIFIVPLVLLQVIPLLIGKDFFRAIEKMDGVTFVLLLSLVLAVVDVVLVWVVLRRFTRERLNLE